MRWLIGALIAMLLVLQYRIWVGPADAFDALALRAEMDQQRIENERMRERNAALDAEVRDLKQGSEAVEERARTDLGMVKKDETFYRVVGGPGTAPTSAPPAAAPASAPPPDAHNPPP